MQASQDDEMTGTVAALTQVTQDTQVAEISQSSLVTGAALTDFSSGDSS